MLRHGVSEVRAVHEHLVADAEEEVETLEAQLEEARSHLYDLNQETTTDRCFCVWN